MNDDDGYGYGCGDNDATDMCAIEEMYVYDACKEKEIARVQNLLVWFLHALSDPVRRDTNSSPQEG
jgi:hypothetical protein